MNFMNSITFVLRPACDRAATDSARSKLRFMLRSLGAAGIEGHILARPKPLLLLAYLTLAGPQSRGHLAELFWPSQDQARRSLTTAIRRVASACPQAIGADSKRVWSNLSSDVAELRSALHEGELTRALALYNGPFLAELDLPAWPHELEEWVYAQREAIAEELRSALLLEAQREADQGRFDLAASSAESAYHVAGAVPPEPELLIQLHTMLLAADHQLSARLKADSSEYGLPLVNSTAEARGKLAATRFGNTPHRLPLRGGNFIGREMELAELSSALSLSDRRLLTLVGPGGAGKTRLALETAQQALLAGAYPDGVFFVELETIWDAAIVPDALAEALQLETSGSTEPLSRVIEYLQSRQILLVLDNIEQLPGIGQHITALLEHCYQLTLLVTSRHRLLLPVEWVMELPGLSYPDGTIDLDEAVLHDAPHLFLQRARQVRGSPVSRDELPHVLRLCQLLAGAPLGLELAAAWTHMLSCQEIADEVEHTHDILAPSDLRGDQRHSSLRAVFAHSWNLLSANEQVVLAQLSLFRSGFTRAAAAQVAGCSLATLASLTRKSLVKSDESDRYRLLEVTREYASEQLAADPVGLKTAANAHVGFVLALATQAETGLRGKRQVEWTTRLTAERPNIRAALDWCQQQNEAAAGLRIVAALQMFWWLGGMYREGLERTQALLALPGSVPATVRAKALHRAGTLVQELGDYALARGMYDQALELATVQADTRLQADTLHSLGLLATRQGNTHDAALLYERCLALQRGTGDEWGLSVTLNNVGVNLIHAGRYEEARAPLLEALLHKRALNEQQGTAYALHNLGTSAYGLNELDLAEQYVKSALTLKRELADAQGIATGYASLGRIALRRDQHDRARSQLFLSLHQLARLENRWTLTTVLTAAAELEATVGRNEAALQLVGGVEALCNRA